MIEEKQASTYSGYLAIPVLLALTLVTPVAVAVLPVLLKIPMMIINLMWKMWLWLVHKLKEHLL